MTSTIALADVVATSAAVAATRSRKVKTEAIATLLAASSDSGRPEAGAGAALTVAYLAGDPRQGRIGVGWATIDAVRTEPADHATLTLGDVDTALSELASVSGEGSAALREAKLVDLFTQATAAEADFLRRLLLGDLHQGANEGIVVEGVARAAGVPATVVRRALMLSGELGRVAAVAMTEGRPGLEAFRLRVLRPLRPMLAVTAADVGAAVQELGPCSVEWKLDGARIQAHRHHDRVRIVTRSLNDITARLPDVAALLRSLPGHAVVLDGEILGMADDERPQAFQDTMSGFTTDPAPDGAPTGGLRPWFFDCLHVDGTDLVDAPLAERLEALATVAGRHRVPGTLTDDPTAAEAVLAEALAAGHEGVMVKALHSPYAAGRRGKAWRKVKPVHTFDLVVLAAEWGHGRRRGWLSNLHLGARDDHGGFVMVGKTFKGLTDELLAWQTTELLAREQGRSGITVTVRPDLVVEVAIDGVQRSSRYPGGLALRFARVRRYRDDKGPDEADTLEALRSLR